MLQLRSQLTQVKFSCCSEFTKNLFLFKLLHILFILICTLGLATQFFTVTMQYLSYATETRIQVKYPSNLSIPSLTLCLRYTDVLNLTHLNSERGHNWSISDNEGIRSLQNEITVQEIFDYTPNRNEIVISAYFRDETGYSNGSCDFGSCQSTLRVSKFIYVEYICYTIDLIKETIVKPKVISVHPIDTGVLASFSFSDAFFNVTRFKLSLHSPFSKPYISLAIQPIMKRTMSRKLSMYNSIFYVSLGNFTVEYLKAPYVTMCTDYDQNDAYDSQSHCIQTCVRNRVFSEFNKLPYSVFTSSSSERRIISSNDVKNNTVSARLCEIESECENFFDCKRVGCSVRTSISYILPQAGNRSDFDVVINAPQQPWTYVKHEEAFIFVTYITFLMGSFGTWTGISLFGLSPFKQYLQHKRRHDKKSQRKLAPVTWN